MKKLTLLILLSTILAIPLGYSQTSFSSSQETGNTIINDVAGSSTSQASPNQILVATVITHSATQNITPGTSVSCNGGGIPADNSFYRAFDLQGAFGITKDFYVTDVEFGLQTVTGPYTITVNVYSTPGVFPGGALTLRGTAPFLADVAHAGTIVSVPMPANTIIPLGETLVYEIVFPDVTGAGFPSVFLGANSDGQTAPSYISSVACVLPSPTDLAAIGFPGTMWVMNVVGSTAPDAVCQNYTAQLDASGNVTITGTNVDGGSSDLEGGVTLSVSPDTFDCNHVGTPQTVTLTVTDEEGITDTCTATVTVEDNVDPTWTNAPSNMTVECDGTADPSGAFATWLSSFTGTDNCGTANVTDDSTGLSDLCGATGTETVTFTLDDGNGNSITQDATFTIEDTTDPAWTITPFDLTVECNGTGNNTAFLSWLVAPDGDDACGSAVVSHNSSGLSDLCGATGTETVTFTLTDDCGNFITMDATFTIEDTIDPSWVTAPADLTVECDGSGNTAEFAAWLSSFSGDDVVEQQQ